MEAILLASTRGNKYPWTNRTDAIIQRVPMPHDVWMVLNVCTVKMIDINKIKELQLGPTFKKN